VRGEGKGGRNQELVLSAARYLALGRGVPVFSAGTDGLDGPTDAAGALATETTLPRAASLGMDPEDHLDRNDSYAFFDTLGDLVRTGPTGTNVMDLMLAMSAPQQR
jgi:hydroxypyruvate reductase